MKHHGQFYCEGRWVDALGSTPFQLIDPATEQAYATVALGCPAECLWKEEIPGTYGRTGIGYTKPKPKGT